MALQSSIVRGTSSGRTSIGDVLAASAFRARRHACLGLMASDVLAAAPIARGRGEGRDPRKLYLCARPLGSEPRGMATCWWSSAG